MCDESVLIAQKTNKMLFLAFGRRQKNWYLGITQKVYYSWVTSVNTASILLPYTSLM